MRIVSWPSATSASLRFLTDPPVVRQILEHLDASAPAERNPFDQVLPGYDGTGSA